MSLSARSSVSINVDQLCNPVAIRLQEIPTSGKHARTHVLSSMRRQRRRGLSETRKASQQISPRSSHFAPNFRCVARDALHFFSSMNPLFGRAHGGLLFEVRS